MTPEQIASEIFAGLFGGAASTPGKPKAAETTVDSVKEAHRLLKKAEETGDLDDSARLTQIADRHIRIIEIAIASQK